MNIYGSYRKLLSNSKSAMISAIEIYNKPKLEHREEIFSILLINSWQLLLLAILSKNRVRIFEKKLRGQPYRTLGFDETIRKVRDYLPPKVSKESVLENISIIRDYRNTAIHYYHEQQQKHAIYALAHASMRNYRDILLYAFNQDIAAEVSIVLLPMSFNEPPDFVEYFKSQNSNNFTPLISRLFQSLQKLENSQGEDTSRLITHCTIKFEHSNDINTADIIAGKGIEGAKDYAVRNKNPDDSHPFFLRDIIGSRHNSKHRKLTVDMNSYDFQAVAAVYGVKKDSEYCWISKKGGSPRYSQKIFDFLNRLSQDDINSAKEQFKSIKNSKIKRRK